MLSIQNAIALLEQLIETKSLSGQEDHTAAKIKATLNQLNISYKSIGHNIICKNKYFDKNKETLLLNSHHDTVKPNLGYTKNPYKAIIEDDKLYGLGSNDAGGCLVSLLHCFTHFYNHQTLPYNLIFIASAEEEISGKNGIVKAIEHTEKIDLAIIGEPTLLDAAISEKGLMVLDCEVYGKAGHAAREEGENAIYKAMDAVSFFQNFKFEKTSPTLGPIKMSVTQINAGTQHNVVPDLCQLVVDVRSTDVMSNEALLKTLQSYAFFNIKARSTRLNPSAIAIDHPLVQAAIETGSKTYGSPTLSDQALLHCPSMKMGPGDSARSHTADEFIFLDEIHAGCKKYIDTLNQFFKL